MRLLFGFIIFAMLSCASRHHVSDEYLDQSQKITALKPSKRTVILFLIDGLPYATLEKNLKTNRLSHIRKFFLQPGSLLKAHSVFPSLTYTNVSGLLKEQPVHLTGSLGNKILTDKNLINFESLNDRDQFTKRMHGNNIFTRLEQKNLRTVSLDYGLGADATISSPFDFKSGYSASQSDYRYLDRKKLEGLENLLQSTKPEFWPDFIFIHLVGVDFLSHAYGPQSIETFQHLMGLDQDLQGVFKILTAVEKQHQVISILTADHGFSVKIKKKVPVSRLNKVLGSGTEILNEARMAAFYFPTEPREDHLVKNVVAMLQEKNIELVSFKLNNRVRVITRSQELYFDYVNAAFCSSDALAISVNHGEAVCSDRLPVELKNKFYPFFLENLASYFRAEHSPDMIAVPTADSVFDSPGVGFHGGPTEAEVMVPLLMRNALTKTPEEIPPLWKILKFIN